MKIEVRPIEVKKWHGKSGKESFKRPVKIHALVDADRMEYATGLTEDEVKEYSEKLRQDLSPQFDPGKTHPFWDSKIAVIRLDNNTMFFDTDKALDYIKVKILKASRYVANSLKDWENGLYPEASHVIYDETEEAQTKASKVEIKNQAIIACSQISRAKKEQLVLILGGKNLKGKSDNLVTVELDKLIEKDARSIINYLNGDDEYLETKSLVLEALQNSVLRREGHNIKYFDAAIGTDVEDVVNYLRDLKNQDLKIRILGELNK